MVTVKLQGGYGNQMFQVAAAIGLAKKLGVDFGIYDDLRTTKLYKTNHLKGRKPVPAGYKPKRIFKEHPDQEYRELPMEDDICLVGYFQSYKYFEHCMDDVRDFFQINLSPVDSIGIHFRRGDYLNYPNIFPIQTRSYFMAGLGFLFDKSDNIELYYDTEDTKKWIEENMAVAICSSGESNFFHSTPHKDLKKLSSCKYKIIANSSFSAMAAILCPYKDQVVIRPKKWFHTKKMTHILPKTENYIEL